MRILTVIPARGGSKGIPGKNLRLLRGLPLLAHSIGCARLAPSLSEIMVSTDDPAIAEAARGYGALVPSLRPHALAADETPVWPVVRHALEQMEQAQGRYDAVLLLMPTNPGRLPGDIEQAVALLEGAPDADGVISVSVPSFNPLWVCVTEENGWLRSLFPDAGRYGRRQDVPTVYRINGLLYLWRRDFVAGAENWREGRLRMLETPEWRAVDIDAAEDFEQAERLFASGGMPLPWLESNL